MVREDGVADKKGGMGKKRGTDRGRTGGGKQEDKKHEEEDETQRIEEDEALQKNEERNRNLQTS